MDQRRAATVQHHRPDRGTRIAGLMDAARQGSEYALGEIVTELSPLLWQVARATGLSAGDAEDVLQTVWLRLVAHLGGIHDAAALTGWLVTTTRREAWRVRAAGRRQFPADHETLDELPESGPGTEEQVVVADEQRELWAAIGPRAARNCCGSSPSRRGPTTPRWPPPWACPSGASAPPAAAAWPSCASCWTASPG
jgi:hypothetical protein